MAIATSFAVGAIFEIEDRATPVLGALSEGFAKLQGQIDGLFESMATVGRDAVGGLETSLGKVTTALDGIVTQAKTAGDAISAAMAQGADAATAAAARMTEAAATLGRAAAGSAEAAAPLPSLISPAAQGAIAGAAAAEANTLGSESERVAAGRALMVRPGSDYTFGGEAAAIPLNWQQQQAAAASQRRGSHLVPLVEAAAVAESMKLGASEEQSIDITLLRGFGIDPRKATDEQKHYLQDLARRSAVGTSFSEQEVAAGEAVLAAPLGFRGDEGMRQFGSVFEVAAKAAEAAKQLRFGTFEGGLEGAVEFAHQLGQYDAPGLTKSMNLLGAITESLPQGDLQREALVMGYAIPQARALGVDTGEAMESIGFLQRAGMRNTVAATTFRQMLVGMLREGGPMTAHLTHEDRQLRESLMMREDPAHGVHGRGNLHDQALINLGIMDRQSHKLLVENAQGGLDVDKAFGLMAEAQRRMSPVEFGRALYGAFGVRGENVGILAEALPRFRQYQETVEGTAPLDEQLKMISGSTQQITGQAVARVTDVATAIGQDLNPALVAADKAIIAFANDLYGIARDHPVASGIGAGAGVLGLGAAFSLGVRSLFRGLGRWINPGAAGELGEGVLARAGGAAMGAVGSMLRTPIGGFASLLATNELAGKAADWIEGMIFGPESVKYRHATEERWNKSLWESIFGKPAFGATDQVSPRAQAPDRGGAPNIPPGGTGAAPNVTINLGPVTMNGIADESTFRAILDKLKDALHTALQTATGTAQGTWVSPYEYGSGP